MLEALVSGLVTGWAIAVPVGAIAAFLVTVTARNGLATGAAGALGIATVDGVYATVAITGGAALAAVIAPVATPLRIASAVVLLVIAALTTWRALTAHRRTKRVAERMRPLAAYTLFTGITAVNPATVVYFAAVVLGNRGLVDGPGQGVAFVAAAFAASASWQLTLAAGGAALGRFVASARGQRVTGVVSGLVIAGLALWTLRG